MSSSLPPFVLSRCAIRREGKIEELPQNQPYLKNPQKQFAEAPRASCITGTRLNGASCDQFVDLELSFSPGSHSDHEAMSDLSPQCIIANVASRFRPNRFMSTS